MSNPERFAMYVGKASFYMKSQDYTWLVTHDDFTKDPRVTVKGDQTKYIGTMVIVRPIGEYNPWRDHFYEIEEDTDDE